MVYTSFNEDNFREFKEVYSKALEDKKEEFTFNNTHFNTRYATYLVEYLNERFQWD